MEAYKMINTFKFNPNLDYINEIEPKILKTCPGIHYTKITGCEVSETKNGSPLLKLTLKPYNFIFECTLPICVSLNPITHRYFSVFCESIGLKYPIDGSLLLNDIIGKSGFVKYKWQDDYSKKQEDLTNKKYLIAEHFLMPEDVYVQFKEK
jgi:hypothetical protein